MPVLRSGDDNSRRETELDEQQRRATTEALFRDVNERIAEAADGFDASRTEFVCECADPNCTHRVQASLAEYEEVREEPTTFLVVPGHEHDDIERIVSDRGGFRIVEKVHAAVRRTVVRLDPRRRSSGPGEP
jgi:transcription initiation factor TFIID subunit TAF12